MKIIVANAPCYQWQGQPYQEDSILWAWRRSGSRWSHSIPNSLGGYHQYPFMLGYTTSYLLENGINAMMLDSVAARHTYCQFFSIIEKNKPDIVITEISSGTLQNDLQIAKKLKDFGTTVILTGNYATVNYQSLLKEYNFVDSIIRGEYEKNSLQAAIDWEHNKLEKYYDYNIFQNLDELPFPYRDDNLIWLYLDKVSGTAGQNQKSGRKIFIQSSRGCAFECKFCDWQVLTDHKIRKRSPESVGLELDYLINRFGNEIFIYFDDDMFNFGDKRTRLITDELAKRTLNWGFLGRIDTNNIDTWKYMIERGLKSASVGIESGDQEIVNEMNKKLDLTEALKMCQAISKDIHLHLSFAHPEDSTEEQRQKTYDFYVKSGAKSKSESMMVPLAGSDYYNELKLKGKTDKDIEFDGYKQLLKNQDISKLRSIKSDDLR